MEKGTYFVASKDRVPLFWKNENFFTEEELGQSTNTGEKPEKALPLLFPLFSEAWMALQYIKRHSLEGAQVGLIDDQEYWSYLLKLAKETSVSKIITNPCIIDTAHECMLLTYDLDSVEDFTTFDSLMKSMELPLDTGGYNKNNL